VGVGKVFERMAESMPRLAAIRTQMAKVHQTVALQAEARETLSQSRANEKIRQRARARAEEGYAHAQFAVAEEILTTPSSQSELAEAQEFLERAALGGYVPAQILLAMVQAEGVAGQPSDSGDIAQAHAWLAAAAEAGNQAAAKARDNLAREFRDGEAVKAVLNGGQLKQLMAMVTTATGAAGESTKLNEQLRHAAVLGDTESVHVLLAKNADADDADEEGRTPIIEAAWRGYPAIVKALINAGARLEGKDATGKDAMAWAAINGHAHVVASLIAEGAPVDSPDQDGFTPLMRAAWNGHTAVVMELVRAGARGDLRNRFGRSARDYAREQRNQPI
jgi:TPR repeat protein